MAKRCDSETFIMKTTQPGKLKDQDYIMVNVLDQLASCARINTRNIAKELTGMDNLTSIYNASNVPEDVYGCSKNKCYNTGTFQGPVTAEGVGADNEVIIGDFSRLFDASLYGGGMLTAYVLLPAGEHEVSLEIANYEETGWTNSNTIKYTVHATQSGEGSYLYPISWYLGDLTGTKGTGWTATTVGAKVRIHIKGTNLKAGDLVGVSSFAFYESLEDLKINQTVFFKCLNNFGDNQSFDIVESQCSQTEYNTSSGQITFSLVANQYTPNYRYLNPTYYDDPETTEHGLPHIVTRTVKAGTGELEGYGIVQLSDKAEGCGMIYVQTPGCANNSSSLNEVSSPVPVAIGTGDFQVLTKDYNGVANQGTVLVDKQWIGQELNIIYLQNHSVKAAKITNEFREFNVTIIAPFRKKDKTTEFHKYENALMSVDANNISRTDETALELQFTVAADENGVKKRILEQLD